MPKQLPYGSWPSPISASLIVEDTIGIDEIQLHQDSAYWIEKRPSDKGRCVIVHYNSNTITDCLEKEFSTRTRAHEYGGASYCVTASGLYFINDSDQQIYHIDIASKTKKLTSYEDCRFADMVFDDTNNQIICICEDHSKPHAEPTNTLIAISTVDGTKTVLSSGYSFYSNPKLNSNNQMLAWLCWNHPNMPWNGTELWAAELSGNILQAPRKIAGSDNISICQPQWSPGDILTFVSDETGWWNLYQHQNETMSCLYPMQAEFAVPQWVFGQSSYQYVNENTIHCIITENSVDSLAELDIASQTLTVIDISLTTLSLLKSDGTSTWLIGSSSSCPPQVIKMSVETHNTETIKNSFALDIEPEYLSIGHNIEFTTRHDDKAHAIYYPPSNGDYTSTGLPPLIVLSHGGPTANTSSAFDIRKQYWTSRGFALLDVNYSGSTGFGRAYRERLNGQWGIRDVEDCCDAALYAVDNQLADPEQLLIKGGSAGGYSVLCALTFHDVFSAGASYYGIGDLETLTSDTHKFESRYLDKLVGPYPEEKQIYLDRSPIHHVEQLNCPVIFFQGADDHVVPKQQAEKMVSAIESKGLPVAYLEFEGEGHGFRKSETIKDTIVAEYYFYSKILGFTAAEKLNPIAIRNMSE